MGSESFEPQVSFGGLQVPGARPASEMVREQEALRTGASAGIGYPVLRPDVLDAVNAYYRAEAEGLLLELWPEQEGLLARINARDLRGTDCFNGRTARGRARRS